MGRHIGVGPGSRRRPRGDRTRRLSGAWRCRAGCLRRPVDHRWWGRGASARRGRAARRWGGSPTHRAGMIPCSVPVTRPCTVLLTRPTRRWRLLRPLGCAPRAGGAWRPLRASALGRAGGTGLTLLQQEEAESTDQQGHHGGGEHHRKSVDQRIRDVDRQVFQCGAVLLRDQALSERHRDEQDQRWLDDRGEQRPIAGSGHCEDTAEEIERGERSREFGATSRIDSESDKGDSDGQENDTPPGETGDRRDNRPPVERHPRASTLGCRHTTTVAATC